MLYFWFPCGNSTAKRFDNATAHTRGRWVQALKLLMRADL